VRIWNALLVALNQLYVLNYSLIRGKWGDAVLTVKRWNGSGADWWPIDG
jgi:hypothetical protein